MAIMIPRKPRKFDPASQEGIMFGALESLPDEFFVFHSFRITDANQNVFHESETDFVIYNQTLGVLSIEAKAGQVRYEGGEWLYGNGQPMHNDGPFNQASANKHKLRRMIANTRFSDILDRCKFLHAVWFPSITDDQVRSMPMPPEADRALILTKNALVDPEPYLLRIFTIKVLSKGREVSTSLSDSESRRLIREVLCPEFNVFPSVTFESDLKKIVFNRLLDEQTNILNFLEEQKTAAINGAAGTGKTMIACEKAERNAKDGERVLFLCFNVRLKEFLEKTHQHELISYFTIAGYACKLCDGATPDYARAKEKLEDMYISGNFPYKHIIIDEGQDFGNELIEEAEIIDILYDIIADHDSLGGSFYVFYDRYQLIQAKRMPGFIEKMDCKLTLYRNCRNTENIAINSLKTITGRSPKLFEGSIKGAPVKIHYCNDASSEIERIDTVINGLVSEGLKDIVILTCKTESTSVLSSISNNGKYKNKYIFTTCRKFKGLEADAVVLIDIDKDVFSGNQTLIYYVGASRAKLKLDVMAILSDVECQEILARMFHYSGNIRKAKKNLAGALYAIGTLRG